MELREGQTCGSCRRRGLVLRTSQIPDFPDPLPEREGEGEEVPPKMRQRSAAISTTNRRAALAKEFRVRSGSSLSTSSSRSSGYFSSVPSRTSLYSQCDLELLVEQHPQQTVQETEREGEPITRSVSCQSSSSEEEEGGGEGQLDSRCGSLSSISTIDGSLPRGVCVCIIINHGKL